MLGRVDHVDHVEHAGHVEHVAFTFDVASSDVDHDHGVRVASYVSSSSSSSCRSCRSSSSSGSSSCISVHMTLSPTAIDVIMQPVSSDDRRALCVLFRVTAASARECVPSESHTMIETEDGVGVHLRCDMGSHTGVLWMERCLLHVADASARCGCHLTTILDNNSSTATVVDAIHTIDAALVVEAAVKAVKAVKAVNVWTAWSSWTSAVASLSISSSSDTVLDTVQRCRVMS